MSEMKFETEVFIDYEIDGWSTPFREKVFVTWTLELECREYGVKSFIVTAPDQQLSFSVKKDDENGDEQTKDILLDATNLVTTPPTEFNGMLAPCSLEFRKGKWVLEF